MRWPAFDFFKHLTIFKSILRFERKSNRNLPLIQQYDVKMTSNYVIVSIKFIYLDVGHYIVVCNFNNEHIMSQPTTLPDHFSLTGHLQLPPLELIYSDVQGQGAILGGVVPLGSPSLDPISDEKCSTPVFGRWPLKSIHVFRPGGGHKLNIRT